MRGLYRKTLRRNEIAQQMEMEGRKERERGGERERDKGESREKQKTFLELSFKVKEMDKIQHTDMKVMMSMKVQQKAFWDMSGSTVQTFWLTLHIFPILNFYLQVQVRYLPITLTS